MRCAMIMAGGLGSRLWPMSRPGRPKQLLPLVGGRSLLEVAVGRLGALVPVDRRYLCIAEALRGPVRRAVPEIDDARIFGEPEPRNTVNAIGLVAAVLHHRNPDTVLAVLTSDHVIEPEDRFQRAIELGFQLVEQDPSRLVTFAIEATEPATGFGYVEHGDPIGAVPGTATVRTFEEKPDRATAERYVASGVHSWNSGMFVYHTGGFLDALKRHWPGSYDGLQRIAAAWDGPDGQATLDAVFPTLPKESVDNAIMEPASHDATHQVCMVPMDVRWADLGSWPSYAAELPEDADGHRTNARAHHLDGSNVVAIAEDPNELITTIGCSDLIVVRSGHRTLVCATKDAQRVRELADHFSAEDTAEAAEAARE